jgi:hypothetical protein
LMTSTPSPTQRGLSLSKITRMVVVFCWFSCRGGARDYCCDFVCLSIQYPCPLSRSKMFYSQDLWTYKKNLKIIVMALTLKFVM